MKTKSCLMLIILAIAGISANAQNNFAKDLSVWHKKAVMTCGMIKSPEALSKAQNITKNLDELSSGLKELTKKYLNNPPTEYKNDPLWASYFTDLTDNLTVVKHFATKQEYRVASKNCSVFCKTILRMHKNNATIELTDMLFSLNMQLKLTTDMSNAGNVESAKNNIALVNKIIEHASKKVTGSKDANLQALFVPVEKTAKNWIKAIETGDAATAKTLYASFIPDFKKIFMASM